MAANIKFEPIDQKHVTELLQILQEFMPNSTVAYHWLSVQLDWVNKIADLELRILCPGGDWRQGDVLALVKGLLGDCKWSAMFYVSRDSDIERARSSLTHSSHIPWSEIAHFTGVHSNHVESLLAVLEHHGLTKPCVIPCLTYHMTSQQAANLELPQVEGMRVSRLDSRYITDVCTTWPHFSESLRPLVTAMLTHNQSFGVFDNDKLAASVLHTYYGGIGLLQTLPDYQRRGLASLALAHLARELGRAGVSPHLHIMCERDKAEGIIRRLGFILIGKFSRIVL